MKTKSLVIGLGIAAAFGGYFLLWQEIKVQAISMPTPRVVPTFHLRDIQDRAVSSDDLRGKPAVIQIWATWCEYCREQLRNLMALQHAFDTQTKFIAINRAQSADVVIPYWYDAAAEFLPASSPIPVPAESALLFDPILQTFVLQTSPPPPEVKPEIGVSLVLDPKDNVYHELNGFAMPETILVAPDGTIRDHIRGPISKEELHRRIEQAFGL